MKIFIKHLPYSLLIRRETVLLTSLIVFLFSCGNEKVLQLPEISHSDVTDIKDVSHAYLFYDETQPDYVELNRKNLISTTNWLINVDKRLTLKQAIPHITYLQNKKANSSHINKEARNYFTCNDTSIKNLGFIEFTNVSYKNESLDDYAGILSSFEDSGNSTAIAFESYQNITIASTVLKSVILETTKDSLSYYLKKCDAEDGLVLLNFNEALTFQDYMSYKSIISKTKLNHSKISNKEFIFN